MEFIDNLYALYKNKLTGDEEDALIIIEGILQSMGASDINHMISQLPQEEKHDMLALFLYERFRQKMAEEGMGASKNWDDVHEKYYH
ncbi:hypothetical protein SAMN05192534_11512 [Alteribacillus persepolensis]|uniref:Uncharacterized protein n=1 Tax=Alteribacillus persepolensis TaxID=568899 RepID=A0A1G8GBK1_9BACI|nr:DUF6154 family protein [Alteribacillus persepolensis]SDH91757.1 hypothetical protein SAMN05192534_11512 [Alteribacillus persepolensis]